MTNNNYRKPILSENCLKLNVNEYVALCRSELEKQIIDLAFDFDDVKIQLTSSKTGNGGTRRWFCCPICNKRVGIVYKHPISKDVGCRKCLKIDYKKHRYKGMLESQI
jgi:hypothetical protein